MDFKTATNKQLNIRLATAMGAYIGDVGDHMPDGVKVACEELYFLYSEVDYCTDWSATMPLAVEHKISLIPSINEDYYRAVPVAGDAVHDKSPLRAIVICLIKVLESEQ